jgi:hypothetical protein
MNLTIGSVFTLSFTLAKKPATLLRSGTGLYPPITVISKLIQPGTSKNAIKGEESK